MPVERVMKVAVGGSALFLALAASSPAAEQPRRVSFDTTDGGVIVADLYPGGAHGVVLAHGAVFDKESWSKQAVALVAEGLTVLAIDFRGYGKSQGGSARDDLSLDVLGAVAYLREQGAEQVSVLGGSMGAAASASAARRADVGSIHKLILLAPPPFGGAENLRATATLFVVSRGDGLRSSVEKHFEAAPEPKRLVVLKGSAHAQHIFKTGRGAELMSLLVEFLVEEPTQ